MGLQALEDNREIGQMLYQSIADGHLHHAYLFESPKEKQGEELAVAFAQALLCQKAPAIGCGKCSVCRRIQRGEHIGVTMVETKSFYIMLRYTGCFCYVKNGKNAL